MELWWCWKLLQGDEVGGLWEVEGESHGKNNRNNGDE